MSEHKDDPLIGLLTDIADGVATHSNRIDAIETQMAPQNAVTNEALATIAEIATRTYYASKQSNCLARLHYQRECYEHHDRAVADAMVYHIPAVGV